MTAKYIFWDSDNTLTDNGELHWLKHLNTAARYGVQLTDAQRNRIYHNNGAQNWQWLHDELGLDVAQATYLSEIDGWYADHVASINLRPGVAAALALFEAAGCTQCVVSNGRRNSVMLALEVKNLLPHFAFVMCKEDYDGRKPDPAPYLAARARMDGLIGAAIDPRTCLAIEDDPLGVTSAHKAGIPVIHRRLNDADAHAPEAKASVYDAAEFLALIEKQLKY